MVESRRVLNSVNLEANLSRIARFYEEYDRKILSSKKKAKASYLRSTKKALFFIFSFCFYQGRRDELSEKFEKLAKKAFDKFAKQKDVFSLSSARVYDKVNLQRRYDKLYQALKVEGVNKEGDRLMVISLLNFIQSIEEKNIVKYLINKIKQKKLPEIFKELDSVWSVGPKIASLVLRDIVYIYKLEDFVNGNDYDYLQPVDTWVHQIARRFKLTRFKKICFEEARDLARICLKVKVNPIHFNQGAWYIGANSTEILLENLEKII